MPAAPATAFGLPLPVVGQGAMIGAIGGDDSTDAAIDVSKYFFPGDVDCRVPFARAVAALSDLPVAARKRLIIPPGTYTFTPTAASQAALNFPLLDDVEVIGYGATIIIKAGFTSPRAINITAASTRISIVGLRFSMPDGVAYTGTPTGINAIGVGTTTAPGLSMRYCTFTGNIGITTQARGIAIGGTNSEVVGCVADTLPVFINDAGTDNLVIRGNTVTNMYSTTTAPITSTGTLAKVIDGNVINNCAVGGISVVSNASITNNTISNITAAGGVASTFGIRATTPSFVFNVTISNNRVSGVVSGSTQGQGIILGTTGTEQGGSITGNVVNNCNKQGIYVWGSYASITGNLVTYDTESLGTSDVAIAVRGSFVTCSGNVVMTPGSAAEAIAYSVASSTILGGIISNNTIIHGSSAAPGADPRNEGIRLNQCNDTVVIGNTIKDAAAHGVYVGGTCDRCVVALNRITTTRAVSASYFGVRFDTAVSNSRMNSNIINGYTTPTSDGGTANTVTV